MRRILGTYHLDTVSPALPAPGHSSCGAGSSCSCPAPCPAPCSLFWTSSASCCCTRACNMARWHYSPFLFLLYNWAHKIFRAMYGWTKLFYLCSVPLYQYHEVITHLEHNMVPTLLWRYLPLILMVSGAISIPYLQYCFTSIALPRSGITAQLQGLCSSLIC